MNPRLTCPYAKYGERMRIRCTLSGEHAPCAFQYFKACKGWWELLPAAERCLQRKKEETHETR